MTNQPSSWDFAQSNMNSLNPFPNNPTRSNNTTGNNFFQSNKTASSFQRVERNDRAEELKQSKLSTTSLRKSFNADEYMQTLKLKLGERDYNQNNIQNHTYHNNYMKDNRSQEIMGEPDTYGSRVKEEYERLHQQHFKGMENNQNEMPSYTSMFSKPLTGLKASTVEPQKQSFIKGDVFDKEKSQFLEQTKPVIGGSKNLKSKLKINV